MTYQKLTGRWLLCCVLFLLGNGVHAQCTFTFDLVIADNTVTTAEMQVADLVADDLASGQGLCGIRVSFRHEYVGDLTMELVSPSGQSVFLVGPVTDQISATNLTSWNVLFTTCGAPATPDAGFTANWSNDQAWAALASYTGTYYPNTGCLEDFNMGSANGLWQLFIRDSDDNATGNLQSVELIFCDSDGLSCSPCDADAGEFTDQEVVVCDVQDVTSDLFVPGYRNPGDRPDPSNYGYLYTIGTNGGNVVVTDDPDGFAWQQTQYTICGISFDRSDSLLLRSQLDTMNQQELNDAFSSGQVLGCTAITPDCMSLRVSSNSDTTFLDERICEGGRIVIDGQVFDETGEYFVDLQSKDGCDSTVGLDLEVIEIRPRIDQLDTLTCARQTIELSAEQSTVPGTASYAWSTQNGLIVGSTTTPRISVGAPGVYQVVITSMPSGCTSTRSIEIETDDSLPFVAVDNYEISCAEPDVVVEALVFEDNLDFLWTGPGGFSSNLENPTLVVPGVYQLRVTDQTRGCSNITSFRVNGDFDPPAFNLGARRECENQRFRLFITPVSLPEYRWEGPSGFTSSAFGFFAPTPGRYYGYVTGDNGCIGVDSFDVDFDYDIPDVTASSLVDSLSCGEITTLVAVSSVSGVIFDWTGPGLDVQGTDSVETDITGEYIVTAEATNGCSNVDTVEVFPASDRPDVLTFSDTLTCLKDTATIGVVPAIGVTRYEWTGPGLIDTFDAFVRVTAPGNYAVRITDVTGCISTKTITVESDTRQIRFDIESDTLTCTTQAAGLWFETNEDWTSIRWETPDGVILTDSAVLVDRFGEYQLTLIGNNGCPRTSSYVMPYDTAPPSVFIENTLFGCVDSVQLRTLSFDTNYTYVWSGPGGFSDSVPEPFIFAPGAYNLLVTAANGCTRERGTDVLPDFDLPPYNLTAELLDCIDSSAVLSVFSSDTLASFMWSDGTTDLGSDSAITVEQPMTFYVTIRGGNNCVALDSAVVEPAVTPSIASTADTLNCRDVNVQLIATSDSSGMTYEWFDSSGALVSTDATYSTSEPGVFQLVGTWINGCTSDTSTFVDIDTVRPVAFVETDQIVRCENRQVFLSGALSMGDSLLYSWSTSNGDIIFGETSDSAFVRDIGLYTLVVTEAGNFCTDAFDFELEESPSTLREFTVRVVPECQGNSAGQIKVLNVDSATSSMLYSIGGDFERGGQFDSLVIGTYLLTGIDSFGCTLDTLLQLSNTSSEVTVSLGPDIRALLGDEITLEATVQDPISEIFWDPAQPCDSCSSNTVTPLETSTYTVFIRDLFGCLAQDEITVFIAERAQVFVPNVFSPNGDGKNDVHFPSFHPGVREITSYAIYDRWGNQVHGAENTLPGAPELEWDGDLKGGEMHAAVFTWIMEVVLLTGRRETLTGDITLLR